jgi:hypothetical protein
MEISEDAGQTWRKMSPWMRYFLDLGHKWPRRVSGPGRTIRIISLPIKTPAAGLIALGAVAADLKNPSANDKERHYDSLLAYARQYLHACKTCKIRCRPDLRKCGYAYESTGILRHKDRPRSKLYVSSQTDFAAKVLRLASKSDGSGALTTIEAAEWTHNYFEDEGVPLLLGQSSGSMPVDTIRGLFPDDDICNDNLTASYSSLCLAGGAAGQTAMQGELATFQFGTHDRKSLASLLPINGWDDGATELSRLVYFNTRGKGAFGQPINTPNLVIAEGMDAFASVLSEKKLKSADVIALVSRIHERDKMEEFGALLEAQSQWYDRHELGSSVVPGCFEIELRKRVAS